MLLVGCVDDCQERLGQRLAVLFVNEPQERPAQHALRRIAKCFEPGGVGGECLSFSVEDGEHVGGDGEESFEIDAAGNVEQ